MRDPAPGDRADPVTPVAPVDPRRMAALVALLSDESPSVSGAAEDALRATRAPEAELRAHAEALDDPAQRVRARRRLEVLRLETLERDLEALAVRGGSILEEGAFLLARVVTPDLDAAVYSARLDAMADDLRAKLPGPPLRAQARALVDFVHIERGFHGDLAAYEDPENALLNRVLDRRTGIPTSLGVMYILLGRRLGLALESVNLPKHFLVRCADAGGEAFIDAFAGGRFLTRDDCRQFLRGAGLEARPEFLLRVSDRVVLSRLARSLAEGFRARGSEALAGRFARCLTILGAGHPDERSEAR